MKNDYKRLRGGPPPYKNLLSTPNYDGKVFGAESETSCLNNNGYIENTDLPLAAKKRLTEVINKISFQI